MNYAKKIEPLFPGKLFYFYGIPEKYVKKQL